jgi:SAM-dependent methyltransferase
LRELEGLPTGRLLDVGAGKGHFLAAARGRGWDVVGVELSEASARRARATYGLEMLVGDVLEIELAGSFDVITLWHVLEHVADPGALLDRVRGLLAPGGRLVVSVPNNRSFQARLFGEHWFHIDEANHLFHFTPRSLAMLLLRRGFEPERVGYFYPEMEIIGWVQSALNAAGLHRDGLYKFVKRDASPQGLGGRLLSTVIAAAVTPAAVAAAVTMPALRTGASMQMRARCPASRG